MERNNLSKRSEKKLENKILIKRLFISLLLFGSIFFLKTVFTKHVIIKNNNMFSRIIRNPKYNLAIAMFYNSGKMARKEDPAIYRENTKLVNMFKDASNIFRYNDADLMFLTVNILDKHNLIFSDIYELASVPRFMLFRDGQVYTDAAGRPIVLRGFVTRPQLQKFIDTYFGIQIQENRERNKEIRDKKIEQNLANAYYWGGGWGPWYGGYWAGDGWGGYGYGAGGYWGGSIGIGGTWSGCGRGGYGRGGGCGGRGSCGGRSGGCGGRGAHK